MLFNGIGEDLCAPHPRSTRISYTTGGECCPTNTATWHHHQPVVVELLFVGVVSVAEFMVVAVASIVAI